MIKNKRKSDNNDGWNYNLKKWKTFTNDEKIFKKNNSNNRWGLNLEKKLKNKTRGEERGGNVVGWPSNILLEISDLKPTHIHKCVSRTRPCMIHAWAHDLRAKQPWKSRAYIMTCVPHHRWHVLYIYIYNTRITSDK